MPTVQQPADTQAPIRRATPASTLVLTRDAPYADWLEARRWREGVGYCIGASEFPAILDLPECGTPREVYQDKINKVSRPETEAMRWGKLHEKTIADEWQHRRRTRVINVGLVSSINQPWMQTTLDRRVAICPDNPELRSRCALEVKTRGAFRNARWHAEVPDDILAQCMAQMMVTGYRHIHTAILVGGSELHDPVVWWDEDLAAYLFNVVYEYREKHLVGGVEPDWSQTKSEKELALDALMHPDRVGVLALDNVGQVNDYAIASSKAGREKKRREAALARLAQTAGGRRTLTFAGEPAAWWSESLRTNVNLEVLARFPEAYAAAVTTKTVYTININPIYRVSVESD